MNDNKPEDNNIYRNISGPYAEKNKVIITVGCSRGEMDPARARHMATFFARAADEAEALAAEDREIEKATNEIRAKYRALREASK